MRKSNYSLGELLYNVKCVLGTKLLYPGARLIRTPITVRGRRYMDLGSALTTGRNCQLEVNGEHEGICLRFGSRVNMGHNVRIQCAESITIGDHVLIGSRVTIIDNSHGSYAGEFQDSPDTPPDERELKTAPIEIGENVWIGDGAVIQSGTRIGRGCVVGANTVLGNKTIPDGCIVVGSGRIIKKYDRESGRWLPQGKEHG